MPKPSGGATWRCATIVAHIAAIDRAQAPTDETIAWVERGDGDGRYSLNCAPYDVADFLRATLFAHTQSVVLTSATIAPVRVPARVRSASTTRKN